MNVSALRYADCEVDIGLVTARPAPMEGQITDPAQLLPGVEIACVRGGEVWTTMTVMSEPYSDTPGGNQKVDVVGGEGAVYRAELYLADAGVVPYSDGRWHTSQILDITDQVS